MSNKQPTPGPWILETIGEGSIKHLVPTSSDHISILTVVSENDAQFAAVYEDADARLIAHAPTMLHALQDIVRVYGPDSGPGRVAYAAITKATEVTV